MFIIWTELSKLSFTSQSTQNRSFRRRLLFDMRLSHLMNIAYIHYIQDIGRTRAQNQLIVLSVSLSCSVLHQNTDKRVRTLRFINFSVRWWPGTMSALPSNLSKLRTPLIRYVVYIKNNSKSKSNMYTCMQICKIHRQYAASRCIYRLPWQFFATKRLWIIISHEAKVEGVTSSKLCSGSWDSRLSRVGFC